VYQDPEPNVGRGDEKPAEIRCARDQYSLNLKCATWEEVKAALFRAETCGQFYDGKALGVE
jgi:hypothetical protein